MDANNFLLLFIGIIICLITVVFLLSLELPRKEIKEKKAEVPKHLMPKDFDQSTKRIVDINGRMVVVITEKNTGEEYAIVRDYGQSDEEYLAQAL